MDEEESKTTSNGFVDPEIANLMGPPPDQAPADEGHINQQNETAPEQSDVQSTDNAIVTDSPNQIGEENIDPATEAAVRDIVAHEGDKLLDIDDKKQEVEHSVKAKKESLIKRFWHNRLARNIVGVLTVLGLLAGIVLPTSRYAVLNTVGVRASTHFSIIDSKSGHPIRNVDVSIDGESAVSDEEGNVEVKNLKLGTHQLVLKKRSFAEYSETITIGWGSNRHSSPYQLDPVGTAYRFVITDWLSNKPISGAEVSDAESVAVSDEEGNVELLIEPTESALDISIKAEGYRNEEITIATTDKTEQAINLVPGSPVIFVSKRSGKYDLYKKDADGKNETVIFAGNGNESSDISVLPLLGSDKIAFASTREGRRDSDGYLLSNLYMVDAKAKTATKIANTEAQKIQLLDWAGNKLIFIEIFAGQSAYDTSRERLMSYDSEQGKTKELARANGFNDIEVVGNTVFYAPSSLGLEASVVKMYKINSDGSSKTAIINKEVWRFSRVNFEKLNVQATGSSWYEVNISDASSKILAGEPANNDDLIYANSPNGKNSAFVDERDGKGVLIVWDVDARQERIIHARSSLTYPIRWLSPKHIVFRVDSKQEVADYIINIDGGEPKKVSDVTRTSPTNRWYYYY